MYYADFHRSLSLTLRYAQNNFKSPPKFLIVPLPKHSIIMWPLIQGMVEQCLTVVPNYSSLPKVIPSKKVHTCHWMLHFGLPLSHSHRTIRVRKHLTDGQVLQSLCSHFKPHRVQHVSSNVIHEVAIS